MKVVYTIRVRPGVAVPVPFGTSGLAIGTTAVNWKVTEGGHLEAVILEFTGVDIRYNDNGTIMSTYPELEEEAYGVANFVANQPYLQTAYDAIDPDQVLSEPPAILSENANEENEFKTKYKSISKTLKIGWVTHGLFEPMDYGHGFNHSLHTATSRMLSERRAIFSSSSCCTRWLSISFLKMARLWMPPFRLTLCLTTQRTSLLLLSRFACFGTVVFTHGQERGT